MNAFNPSERIERRKTERAEYRKFLERLDGMKSRISEVINKPGFANGSSQKSVSEIDPQEAMRCAEEIISRAGKISDDHSQCKSELEKIAREITREGDHLQRVGRTIAEEDECKEGLSHSQNELNTYQASWVPFHERLYRSKIAALNQKIADYEGRLKEIETLKSEEPLIDKKMKAWQSRQSFFQQKRDALGAEAARLLPQILALITGCRRFCIDKLNDGARAYSIEFAKLPAPLWSAWADPTWAQFERHVTGGILQNIRLGSRPEIDLLPGESRLDIPELCPLFSAEGALIIQCNSATKEIARTILRNVVLRAALAMPGLVEFTLLDPTTLLRAFPSARHLKQAKTASRSIAGQLADVVDDIKRVNSVVGNKDRFSALSERERAGEVFSITVAANFPEQYPKDPRIRDRLVQIGNTGPQAGRHLVIEYQVDKNDPHELTLDLSQFKNAEVVDCSKLDFNVDKLPSVEDQERYLSAAAKAAEHRCGPDWNSVIRPANDLFTETSKQRLESPVGNGLCFWFGTDDTGRECANAIVAAQSGPGKSNLLHVLITGLAARYPPGELRFVLIDRQDGIEFKAYGDFPHAEVVSLNSSPATVRGILEEYRDEMKWRFGLFRSANVHDFASYREKEKKLPRLLIIIDEYQNVDDDDGDDGACQAVREILAQGRTAGMHVVLCTNSLTMAVMGPEDLSDVHLISSLILTPSAIAGSPLFDTEGKQIIKEFISANEIVINDRNGLNGHNKKGLVALIRDDSRQQLMAVVEELRTKVGRSELRTIVLDGNEGARLSDNPFVIKFLKKPPTAAALQEYARQPSHRGGFGIDTWNAGEKPLALWLGRKFDARGHVVAALRRTRNENLLVLGVQKAVRLTMIANALVALIAMIPSTNLSVDIIDPTSGEQSASGILKAAAEMLTKNGATARCRPLGEATAIMARLAETLRTRLDGPPEHRLLVLNDPEEIPYFCTPAPGLMPPQPGPAADLRFILENGPALGCHVILSADGVLALSRVLHPAREGYWFNHRAVQNLTSDELARLFDWYDRALIDRQAKGHLMSALYVNMVKGARRPVLFKSYGIDHDVAVEINADNLRAALRSLTTE